MALLMRSAEPARAGPVSKACTAFMKSKLEYVWPLIGLAAVAFSIYLLSNELKDVHVADVWRAIAERGWTAFGLCVLSTLVAYAALAWYDRIALMHVGKVLSWAVVSVVSFVAYAVGHNIGVSVLSSGVVRYRAYSRMGLEHRRSRHRHGVLRLHLRLRRDPPRRHRPPLRARADQPAVPLAGRSRGRARPRACSRPWRSTSSGRSCISSRW